MITNFEDKVAVITGGGHGIGYSLAENCLKLGMKVVITASRQSSIDEAVAKLDAGDRLIGVASNAGDAEANFALAKLVEEKFGQVNLLVLNAGVSGIAPIHDITVEEWDKTISVNLSGVLYGVKAFLPLLEKQEEAHIVITSSIFGLFAAGMQPHYFASKAGVIALAESMYYDLQAAESNVGITVTCPGNTRTNMAEANITEDTPPELAEAIRAEVATGTDPKIVTDNILDCVRTNTFYSFPNTGDFQMCIDARIERLQSGRNPEPADVGDTI